MVLCCFFSDGESPEVELLDLLTLSCLRSAIVELLTFFSSCILICMITMFFICNCMLVCIPKCEEKMLFKMLLNRCG